MTPLVPAFEIFVILSGAQRQSKDAKAVEWRESEACLHPPASRSI
jgi:hypothetical protein